MARGRVLSLASLILDAGEGRQKGVVMNIVDALLGEHGILYALLEEVDRVLPELESVDEVRALARVLGAAVQGHAALEDELLFVPLERRLGGRAGPIHGMRTMHEDIDGALERVLSAGVLPEARDQVSSVTELLRQHFMAEEEVIFPMAEEVLDEEMLSRLAKEWMERRGVLAVGSGL